MIPGFFIDGMGGCCETEGAMIIGLYVAGMGLCSFAAGYLIRVITEPKPGWTKQPRVKGRFAKKGDGA